MRILVCFKTVPNWDKVLERDWEDFGPESDIAYAGHVINCFDESALEVALRLKDSAAQSGGEVWCAAATAGPLASGFAQSLYAAGFDEVVHIPLESGEFAPARVARKLAACARTLQADLVMTGMAAGMADTGTVPFLLAEGLGMPVLPEALAAGWADGGIAVTTQNRQGVWHSRARLPLVVSVGNSTAVLRAVPLRARLQAKNRPVVELEPEGEPAHKSAQGEKTRGGGLPTVAPAAAPPDSKTSVRLLRPNTARQCQMLDAEPLADAARTILEVFRTGAAAGARPSGECHMESGQPGGGSCVACGPAGLAPPPGLSAVCYQAKSGAPGLAAPLLDKLLADWQARRPDLALFPPTAEGQQMLAHLAAHTGAGSMAGVTAMALRGGRLAVRKKACSSNLEWEQTLALPALVGLAAPVEGVEAVTLENTAPDWLLQQNLMEPARESGLENASLVVIAGAGLATREGCEKARLLAKKLGAGFGITRGALLNGWGGPGELVGQSGARLAPNVCLVLGASGAGAFMTGIEQAGRVLAVNRDPGALVFAGADMGLCADATGLADALLQICE